MHRNALNLLVRLCRQQEGLTTVEYAIAGTLVTLGVIFAFTALGTAVSTQILAIVAQL